MQQQTLIDSVLDVSEFPAGLYFITAMNNDTLVQGKFIKH
jgi:hypothetical protein